MNQYFFATDDRFFRKCLFSSLNVYIFRPDWPNNRGLCLGWKTCKLFGAFGQFQQYFAEFMQRRKIEFLCEEVSLPRILKVAP